jgi:MFS family permease
MAVPMGGTIAAALLPALEALGGVRVPLLAGAGAVGVAGGAFAIVSGAEGRPAVRPLRPFRTIWRAPGMQRLLLAACFYILVLQALLTYAVPSVRAAGLSAFTASAAYFAINVTAMVARVAWGKLADRGGGGRRIRTLVEVGAVAAGGAIVFTLALHAGSVVVVLAALLFGFGALGWNAIVYVIAGERAAPELAGRSFALAATVVFLVSALGTPPLGALADRAGWDAFWITTGVLAAVGALIASGVPRLRPD